jgi:hypothetical protein
MSVVIPPPKLSGAGLVWLQEEERTRGLAAPKTSYQPRQQSERGVRFVQERLFKIILLLVIIFAGGIVAYKYYDKIEILYTLYATGGAILLLTLFLFLFTNRGKLSWEYLKEGEGRLSAAIFLRDPKTEEIGRRAELATHMRVKARLRR